jgi:hypothetical protein
MLLLYEYQRKETIELHRRLRYRHVFISFGKQIDIVITGGKTCIIQESMDNVA